MWTTLAVAATLGLAPAEAGDLALNNVRVTHGLLGPVREGTEVLPGDSIYICFDVEGLRVSDSGKVQYGIALKATDPDGKTVFEKEPAKQEVTASLGGGRVPAFSRVSVGLDQPPGTYTLQVTVTDRANADKSASLTRTFKVLEKKFGLVQLSTTADAEGLLPVPTPGAGQGLWLHYGVVGFTRDKTTRKPKVEVSVRVLDADGKPTLAQPVVGTANDVPEMIVVIPMQLSLLLNRPGKFKVELTAKDMVAGEQAKLTFDLNVFEAK
jgi:hypothetical protein